MRRIAPLLILWASLATAAPAPLPRSTKPSWEWAQGAWVLRWNGRDFLMELSPGGVYSASAEGKPAFVGAWRAEGGVLTVRERAVGGEAYHEFEVDFGQACLGEWVIAAGFYRGARVTLLRPRVTD